MKSMSFQKRKLLDKLRNALAEDKLVVITGAGISIGVPRKKGGTIPSWGELINSIKKEYSNKLKNTKKAKVDLLSKLTPDPYLGSVHGDALIEASEIIEQIIGKEDFANFIANETTEENKKRSVYHDILAELDPRAIITFNYDKCHENGYNNAGRPYKTIVYSDENSLRKALKSGFSKPTLILKAHGCVSEPSSLVLTSSSYSKIINEFRVYRAVIQHLLSRYTILIVGFALRDRDFDQILLTIEREYGSSVQDHIAIMRTQSKSSDPEKERARNLDAADFAALEARYGLNIFSVEEFDQIPRLLRGLSKTPGSFVKKLAVEVASSDVTKRKKAREQLIALSELGKQQLGELLFKKIKKDSTNLKVRSEQIYTLGLLKPFQPHIINLLVEECIVQSEFALKKEANKLDCIECIAHALVSLRGATIQTHDQLDEVRETLLSSHMLYKFKKLDKHLEEIGCQPRLSAYLKASFFELSERSLYYLKNMCQSRDAVQ